jgi:hypothetical protein
MPEPTTFLDALAQALRAAGACSRGADPAGSEDPGPPAGPVPERRNDLHYTLAEKRSAREGFS